jgi:N-acylneuraminate cytidylyltransferase
MRILAIIPARGGSKGLPGKNIKLLNGKPLICYTLDLALKVFCKEDICISTDSLKIKAVVEEYGINVPFLRPYELATDTANGYDVCKHAVKFYEDVGIYYDAIAILQPTSPFRTAKHILESIKLYTPEIDMVVSVKATKSNPYFVLYEEDEEGYLIKSKTGSFTRRQDCPKVWEFNGAVYIINIQSLKEKPIDQFDKIRKYVMDRESSIDIDEMLDWEICELIINRHNKGYSKRD